MPQSPTREELIAQLKSPGWNLEAAKGPSSQNRTLEEQVRAAHARRMKGEEPGLIKQMENSIELQAEQLQELWLHLGLPM